jgi:hypothetical protein
MDKGTKLRTVLAIATAINTALIATDVTGFENPTLDFIYTVVSLILNFIIVALATYFNNDYTEIAAEKTGEMRQAKLEKSIGYQGEEFFEDEEPDENEDEVADDAE